MSRFGWAYVDCNIEHPVTIDGVTGSVMFLTGNNSLSGSDKFIYNYDGTIPDAGAASSLILTGTFHISGAISASSYHFENITKIDSSGSTFFGNTTDDIHSRTGSLEIWSNATVILTASAYSQQTFVRGFGGNYTDVNSPAYTASTSDYILGVTAINTNVVITVPNPSSFTAGAILIVKDEVPARGGFNITLTGALGEVYSFDNSLTYIITGSQPAISIYSNGTNWMVF
jgi:hypothetical protein